MRIVLVVIATGLLLVESGGGVWKLQIKAKITHLDYSKRKQRAHTCMAWLYRDPVWRSGTLMSWGANLIWNVLKPTVSLVKRKICFMVPVTRVLETLLIQTAAGGTVHRPD